jgi:hypothetical protein
MKRTDLQGPLLQFQSTIYEKGDVFKLLCSLNKSCGEGGLEEAKLAEVFEVWWPYLKEKLDKLVSAPPTTDAAGGARRSTEDLVTEILELVRGQQVLLRTPEAILPPQYVGELLAMRGGEMAVQSDLQVAALLDLESAWERLRSYVKSRPDQGPELRSLVEAFGPPMSFLVHWRHSGAPETRRIREVEAARRRWEVDQEMLRAEDRERADEARRRRSGEAETERRGAALLRREQGEPGRSARNS